MEQEALGEKLGVTNKTVSRWENGHYMPDIEMLQLMSELFSVSINEILCGRRMAPEEIAHEADQNLLNLIKEEQFTLKERMAFWKKKWLREHWLWLALIYLAVISLLIFALVARKAIVVAICPAVFAFLYGFWNNRMMIYVENHLFGSRDL